MLSLDPRTLFQQMSSQICTTRLTMAIIKANKEETTKSLLRPKTNKSTKPPFKEMKKELWGLGIQETKDKINYYKIPA